jgi:hypothetical protein
VLDERGQSLVHEVAPGPADDVADEEDVHAGRGAPVST